MMLAPECSLGKNLERQPLQGVLDHFACCRPEPKPRGKQRPKSLDGRHRLRKALVSHPTAPQRPPVTGPSYAKKVDSQTSWVEVDPVEGTSKGCQTRRR